MKVLTLTYPGSTVRKGSIVPPRKELLRLEARDQYPRSSVYETVLNSDMWRERIPLAAPPWRRAFYKVMPRLLPQVIEAFLRRHDYDVVITWGIRLSVWYALLQRLARARTPHVVMTHTLSRPGRQWILKLALGNFHGVITWSSVQKEYAIHTLGIPSSKVVLVSRRVDQRFFRPFDSQTDMICSVGYENRDYETLLKALDGLGIRCHLATIKIFQRGTFLSTMRDVEEGRDLPPNVTMGSMQYHELRALYARSRFVVVPLLPTDTDNGACTIQESMAMGKAVICTRTEGQVDLIEHGITGFYVPPKNPAALREAILHLWNHPDQAEKIGKAARVFIENHHTVDHFAKGVRAAVVKFLHESSQTHTSAMEELSKVREIWPAHSLSRRGEEAT